MFIKTIHLRNFRNYECQNINIGKGINIFYGANAQGKTNIIESIYFASTGRSHRTNKDCEMVKWCEKESRIKIDYEKENMEGYVDIYLKVNSKKQIKVNGLKLNKIGELLGNLNTVIFSPDHMRIIKEGPSERRRFIDIILSQVKPQYYHNLTQYLKVLYQRNSLLSEIKFKNADQNLLDVWDEQLAEYGSKVIINRINFIENINNLSKNIHFKITDGSETLDINYKPSLDTRNSNENTKTFFQNELKRSRQLDMKNGSTQKGPHRDDLLLKINGKEVKVFGSQGQQRTALLSMKLSELEYMKKETSTQPVLLLDDVFSELDTRRQNFLMNYINNIQSIITCTDVQYFKKLDINELNLFNVCDGNIDLRRL